MIVTLAGIGSVHSESLTPETDRLLTYNANGVVIPGHPITADLDLAARRVQAWQLGKTSRVLLEDDVRLAIGRYGFRCDAAVAFITPVDVMGGKTYRVELYLDGARELSGYGPITAESRRLLVTATIRGGVNLKTDAIDRRSNEQHALVVDAQRRVSRYYQRALGGIVGVTETPAPLQPTAVPTRPQPTTDATPPIAATETEQTDTDSIVLNPPLTRPTMSVTGTGGKPAPLYRPDQPDVPGTVMFQADRVVYQGAGEGEAEDYVLLHGGVRVIYHDPQIGRTVSLTADRAVVFTEPGLISGATEIDANVVRGVYLEDNVTATDGQYTMRGPRVFYDLNHDRAIVLEAVFFTWDKRHQVPIYVRARKVMQVSRHEWRSENARLSTSEFAEPHFAIGSDSLTITEEPSVTGVGRYHYEAKDTSLQVAGKPLFYWPSLSGEPNDIPLRRVKTDADSDNGVVIETSWDLFSLMGKPRPEGVDAELLIDAYTKRGAAVGVDVNYDVPKAFGRLDTYLMFDTGEDEPGGRLVVLPDDELRGKARLQHRHLLPMGWEVSLEVGYVSDETFLEEFFPLQAYTDKPWETSLYVKKQEADEAFTFLYKYDLIDFFPQPAEYFPQAAALGMGNASIEKLPEIALYRIGTPLFNDRVTWFSENRASVMRAQFPDVTPARLGFSPAESMALFGIADTTSFDTGFTQDDEQTYRFDTRQELQMPLKAGEFDLVPYVAGRVTAYDDEFSLVGGAAENVRYWGTVGLKAHAAYSRVYDDATSRLLDINRLRHTIEPSVHVFYSSTNIDQIEWPFVYDYDVETINEGGTVRVGMRNTLETQRGGPGNWRSVEMLRIDTDFVFQADETVRTSPNARFIDYRPEFSVAGDHLWTEIAWQVSDSLQAVSNIAYNFDTDQIERWNAGISMTHDPRLTGHAQFRHIDVIDSTVFRYGFSYLISTRYHVDFAHTIDVDSGGNRALDLLLTRRMQRSLLGVGLSFDTVDNSASVSIVFTPEGIGGQGQPERNPFLFGN